MYKIPCSKCEGKGKIQGFSMIARGVCFKCRGNGYFKVNKKQYEKHERIEKGRRDIKEKIKQKGLQEKKEAKLKERAYWLNKNVILLKDIKGSEVITNEARIVYRALEEQVKKDLNDYKNYKQVYNQSIKEIELILKEYNMV